MNSRTRGYVGTAVLGAVAGGIAVALATRAVPKIMESVVAGIDEAGIPDH